MDLGGLLAQYGYWILVPGALLEGETVVVLAGFAAHRGHLDLPTVIALAALAGWAGDQAWFWVGRRHGAALLRRFPSIGRHAARLQSLAARHPHGVVIGVRFAYGLRIAGPVLLGGSTIPAPLFAALNALGALAWASALALLGWAFGDAAERLLGRIGHIEGWLLLALLLGGLAYWLLRRAVRRP